MDTHSEKEREGGRGEREREKEKPIVMVEWYPGWIPVKYSNQVGCEWKTMFLPLLLPSRETYFTINLSYNLMI